MRTCGYELAPSIRKTNNYIIIYICSNSKNGQLPKLTKTSVNTQRFLLEISVWSLYKLYEKCNFAFNITFERFWQWYVTISIALFPNFAHRLVFSAEHNVFEDGSTSILRKSNSYFLYMSMETDPILETLYSVPTDTFREPSNPTCSQCAHLFWVESNESWPSRVRYSYKNELQKIFIYHQSC